MKNKKCNYCKKILNLECFKKKKSGFQSYCIECQSEYRKKHYIENRSKYIEKSKTNKRKMLIWLKKIKEKYKCSNCPENDPVCIDFHHLNPKEKEFDIAKGIHFSKERVLSEIKKCIALCANCHRKLHFKLKARLV